MANSEIWCLVVDHKNQPSGDLFQVSVDNTAHIADLKEKVKEKKCNDLERIGAPRLTVWRCANKEVTLQKVRNEVGEIFSQKQVECLSAWQTIGELAVSGSEALLVQMPDIQTKKRKHEELNSEQSEESKPLDKIKDCVPLTVCKPPKYQKVVEPSGPIACNRPHTYDKIPIDLLDENFGLFKDRCAAPPSSKAIAFAAKLADVATNWFQTEAERRDEINEVIWAHSGLLLHTGTIFGKITDGNLDAIVMPAAIRACKNEEGHAKNQGSLYYGLFLHQALHSCQKHDTRFPCILIIDIGPTFGFYGAVWNGQLVQVEPLAPIFDLTANPMDERARHAFASSLDAFMEGVSRIQAHYREIKHSTETSSHLNTPTDHRARRSYPYMASYEIYGRESVVAFKSRLDENRLVFTVAHGGSDYIVKFTQRYSKEVHQYLASLGFAPKLFQCKVLPGGWIAVLMERSKYTQVVELSKDHTELVKRRVSEIVQMLHGQDLVHGDILATNLLVDEDSLTRGGDVKVHFVDFDWAGRVGEAKYPFGVNIYDMFMKRPTGVEGGGIITKEHDMAMVSRL
ncbi:hypothetical protein PQX77_020063 [Marasmius sp. AFHP31]|nr:hypothetical protein PQX77_020063 [Marasmius sp. AFHP31]